MGINEAMTRGGSNPIIGLSPTGWDSGKLGPLCIIKMGPTDYRMWFEGVATGQQLKVGYATSSDGTSWSKYGSNPIMVPSVAWENDEVSASTVMWDESERIFKMWYHGAAVISGTQNRKIGYATSSDGLTWSKYASNPVLSPGTAGQWDDVSVADAKVLKLGPTDYRMWYLGRNASVQAMGYATSSDGISWSKYGSNPVFSAGTAGQWDDGMMFGLHLLQRSGDTGFHAWYAADDGVVATAAATGVGYAFSVDGISWVRGRNNPVLVGTASPEEWISDPVFVYEDPKNQTIRLVYYYDNFTSGAREHGEASTNLYPSLLTVAESVRTDTSDPYTFNVTPQGLPRGIAITAVHGTSSTDHIAGITYGGVALTRARTEVDTTTEPGRADVWFLGTNIPTGTQTVSVDLTSGTTDDFQFVVFAFYANGNMEVIDTDGISENVANPSVTLQYGGKAAVAVAAFYGGGANTTDFTPNGNTVGLSEDLGAFYAYGLMQAVSGTSDFTIGGTSGTDDVAFAAAAFAARASLVMNPKPLAHLQLR